MDLGYIILLIVVVTLIISPSDTKHLTYDLY